MHPLAAESHVYAVVFWLALAVCVVPILVTRLVAAGRTVATRRRDGGILPLLVTIGLIVLFRPAWVAPHLPDALLSPNHAVVFSLGIGLMLAGTALFWLARSTLGRRFMLRPAAHPEPLLIEEGPYRLIRHPAYFGRLMLMLGVATSTNSLARLCAVALCASIIVGWQVFNEERAMRRTHGPEYEDYSRRTRRFIPYVF